MFTVARSCTRVAISSFCSTDESCTKFVPCKWMRSKTCMKKSQDSPPPQKKQHLLPNFEPHISSTTISFTATFEYFGRVLRCFQDFSYKGNESLWICILLFVQASASTSASSPESPSRSMAVSRSPVFWSQKNIPNVLFSMVFSFPTSIFKSSTFCHSTFVWTKWKAFWSKMSFHLWHPSKYAKIMVFVDLITKYHDRTKMLRCLSLFICLLFPLLGFFSNRCFWNHCTVNSSVKVSNASLPLHRDSRWRRLNSTRALNLAGKMYIDIIRRKSFWQVKESQKKTKPSKLNQGCFIMFHILIIFGDINFFKIRQFSYLFIKSLPEGERT